MTSIIVINGPNLNLLNLRNKSVYGDLDILSINNKLTAEFPNIKFEFFQSNIEGEIIDKIQASIDNTDALIINPGGYSHTSVAIKDALEIYPNIKIEVHLSNIANREEFRQKSITAAACDGYLSGFKELGYLAAVDIIIRKIKENA